MPASLPSRTLLARPRVTVRHVPDDLTLERDADRPTLRPQPHGDVVIDLTGAPPVTIGPPPQRRPTAARPVRTLRGWHVATIVAVVGFALVAAGVAAVNHRVASQWRERARTAEARASRAVADAAASSDAATQARLERRRARRKQRALAEQLAVSEADAAALEARVIALAGDRARSEDLGGVVREPTVAELARTLQAQVDSCVAQVEAARSALVGAPEDPGWQRALTAARATCEQVATDVDVLAAATR